MAAAGFHVIRCHLHAGVPESRHEEKYTQREKAYCFQLLISTSFFFEPHFP